MSIPDQFRLDGETAIVTGESVVIDGGYTVR